MTYPVQIPLAPFDAPPVTSGVPVRWEDYPGQHAACDAEIARRSPPDRKAPSRKS